MKISALLSLAPLAAALPGARSKDSNTAFSVTAARSGSPIHFLPLTASGGHFYLGGKSQTYCPSNIPGCAQRTNDTVIQGSHSLDVVVPGSQAIYIDPSGALAFTVPHSGYEPAGSSAGPFIYTPGNLLGSWSYTGQGASGFMACPVSAPVPSGSASPTPSATATPVRHRAAASSRWQVFAALQNATVPSGKVGDCLGFDAMAVAVNVSQPAWEYI
ncbi:uncharacterized protein N7459_001620 [Penicillium hispanicum]|uniref:uncharacterized protein n=1 Tax=Penicillium hispanicum TaxID=1080232 RepID=UPI0025421B39|nr:uncharacterized protein N7459_001620 [Penicillium hispanicum]KAJ5595412.1 hypothetical protein N7459_001620 [Penicillium hispanicum]